MKKTLFLLLLTWFAFSALAENTAIVPEARTSRTNWVARHEGFLAEARDGKFDLVFLGDSITDGWPLNEYFPGKDFVNRGISGQITGEMLGRMKADVIDLKPRLVVVLAGTNDLARGEPLSTIENNLSMIADLAEAHHIGPVFASILPVSDYHKDVDPRYQQTTRRPPARIVELNGWLKSFCEQRHFPYVDYYSALADKEGFLQADASDDGLHPNARGYRIMAPLVLAAIDGTVSADARGAKGKKQPRQVAEKPKEPEKEKKKGGIRAWLEKDHK